MNKYGVSPACRAHRKSAIALMRAYVSHAQVHHSGVFCAQKGDLRDVKALLADAGRHQGVEGAPAEVGQHRLLLALRHAAAALALAPALPYEHPAHGHAPHFQICRAALEERLYVSNLLSP